MKTYHFKKDYLIGTRKRKIFLPLTFFIALVLLIFSCKKDDDDNNTGGGNSTSPNLQLVADNLTAPLLVVEAPDDTKRLFIVDQPGQIWIVQQNGTKLSEPFIDITSKMVALQPDYDERGLLGLAFHPNFKVNRKFYLFYTAPPQAGGPEPGTSWNNLTRISEFQVSASDSNKADMGTERILLEENHPSLNHNGGMIAFGHDGFLYVAIGDGGGQDDVGPGHVSDWYATNDGGNAQNISANFMGKVLRIDVNSGNTYIVPADNPFVGTTAKPEIYAYGFRNPYRFSFDMGGSHDLILGDAGQSLYEEIDWVKKGGNYGWNVKEGTVCFNTDSNLLELPDCPDVDSMGNTLIDPVIQLNNAANPKGGNASVIVGGYVYRGSAMSSFQGRYIFGIFSQGENADAKIYSAMPAASGMWTYTEIQLKSFSNNLGQYLKGFGQDLSGEIYVTTSAVAGLSGTSGKVYKLVNQ